MTNKHNTHSYRTLVLDKAYRPIGTCKWQKAICLYWINKVDILEKYEKLVRSPSIELNIPAVIRLKDYTNKHQPRVKFSRRNLYIRDNGICQYCDKSISYSDATIDHVIPKAKGGKTNWNNTVIACNKCNETKGSYTLKEAQMKLVNPQRPNYKVIFRISLGFIKQTPAEWNIYLTGIKTNI